MFQRLVKAFLSLSTRTRGFIFAGLFTSSSIIGYFVYKIISKTPPTIHTNEPENSNLADNNLIDGAKDKAPSVTQSTGTSKSVKERRKRYAKKKPSDTNNDTNTEFSDTNEEDIHSLGPNFGINTAKEILKGLGDFSIKNTPNYSDNDINYDSDIDNEIEIRKDGKLFVTDEGSDNENPTLVINNVDDDTFNATMVIKDSSSEEEGYESDTGTVVINSNKSVKYDDENSTDTTKIVITSKDHSIKDIKEENSTVKNKPKPNALRQVRNGMAKATHHRKQSSYIGQQTLKDSDVYLFAQHLFDDPNIDSAELSKDLDKLFKEKLPASEVIWNFAGNELRKDLLSKSLFLSSLIMQDKLINNVFLSHLAHDLLQDRSYFFNNYFYIGRALQPMDGYKNRLGILSRWFTNKIEYHGIHWYLTDEEKLEKEQSQYNHPTLPLQIVDDNTGAKAKVERHQRKNEGISKKNSLRVIRELGLNPNNKFAYASLDQLFNNKEHKICPYALAESVVISSFLGITKNFLGGGNELNQFGFIKNKEGNGTAKSKAAKRIYFYEGINLEQLKKLFIRKKDKISFNSNHQFIATLGKEEVNLMKYFASLPSEAVEQALFNFVYKIEKHLEEFKAVYQERFNDTIDRLKEVEVAYDEQSLNAEKFKIHNIDDASAKSQQFMETKYKELKGLAGYLKKKVIGKDKDLKNRYEQYKPLNEVSFNSKDKVKTLFKENNEKFKYKSSNKLKLEHVQTDNFRNGQENNNNHNFRDQNQPNSASLEDVKAKLIEYSKRMYLSAIIKVENKGDKNSPAK